MMTQFAPQTVEKRAFRLSRLCALLFFVIAGAVQAQSNEPANPFDYTRTQSFTYNTNGTLNIATIEPDNAPSCMTKKHWYTARGNNHQIQSANCAGASGLALFSPRMDKYVTYTGGQTYITADGGMIPSVLVTVAAGVLVDSSRNSITNQVEYPIYDPRFGVLTQLRDINNLYTKIVVDGFGRNIKTTNPDLTSSVTLYCTLAGTGLDQSADSLSCPIPAASEIPTHAVRFVHTEPRDTNDAKMGPFVRTYFSKLDRQIRTSTESFDGANQTAGRSAAIVVADVVYNQNGAKVIETKPYFLASGSSTTAGSNDVGAVMTDYDVLGRSIASHTIDPNSSDSQTFGSAGAVGYGSYGTRMASTTAYIYEGLATTTINAKGQRRIEEKNARGDIVRVTNTTGAQVAYLPDAFSNVVRTLDALQNSITIAYDIHGVKVKMNDPDKGVIAYCYDALRQLKAQQTSAMRGGSTPGTCPANTYNSAARTLAVAVPNWTTIAYDAIGRMTQRIEPELTSTWYYDTKPDGSSCTMSVGKLCQSVTSTGVTKNLVYDNYGRLKNTRASIANGPNFATAVGYDSVTGRLSYTTYPTGLQVGYTYTALGFLQNLLLKTAATVSPLPNAQGQTAAGATLPVNTVLWKANTIDATGQIEKDQLSNGVVNTTSFEAATFRILGNKAGTNGTTNVLNHQYLWDGINNLSDRIDHNGAGGAITEHFEFDELNRLSQYNVAAPGILPDFNRTVDLAYNALGMMLYKSDVGVYEYSASGPGAVRPHALQSITDSSSASTSYFRDLNGNVTSATGGKFNLLTYTSFDNVITASGPAAPYSWQYDENHSRVKENRVVSANTRTTWYLHPDNVGGLAFESEVNSSPAIQNNRHFLSVGGRTIGVLISPGPLPTLGLTQTAPTVLSTIAINKIEYWHKDHLGSLAATTDHLGSVTQRYSYDPFGKRRNTTGAYDEAGTVIGDWRPSVNYGTDRGFTGHEELDDIGIVNMNGRLYDDTAGLFIQADVHVTNPLDLQDFNRYGYVRNNPLNATDPSGFSTVDPLTNEGSQIIPSTRPGIGGMEGGGGCSFICFDSKSSGGDAKKNSGSGNSANHSAGNSPSGADQEKSESGWFEQIGERFSNLVNHYEFKTNKGYAEYASTMRAFVAAKDGHGLAKYGMNNSTIVGGTKTTIEVGATLGAGTFARIAIVEATTSKSVLYSGVWSLNPFKRGVEIEKAFGQNLPGNFPVIDRFQNGIVTSIKSLDLNAVTYQNAATLNRMMVKYINDVASFNGRRWAGVDVPGNAIKGRALDLAVPGLGTVAQQSVLNQAVQYGATKGVAVNVIRFP